MTRGWARTAAVTLAITVLGGFDVATAEGVLEGPVDAYARYQPQKKCVHTVKPGTQLLGEWLVTRGGAFGGTLRSCKSGGTSEHKDGRAFDWTLDATDVDDAAVAEAFLVEAFADDPVTGETDVLARRMGIMYVIWDDKMYASWESFEPHKYLSSSCRKRRTCSPTLRHRDHVHISLSKPGAAGRTSWYAAQASPTTT
jgi:hypothetical protein